MIFRRKYSASTFAVLPRSKQLMPVTVKFRIDVLVCGLEGDLLWHLSMSAPCFHVTKAFSLSGLEARLPAFQLPLFAKRDFLLKRGLCDMFV